MVQGIPWLRHHDVTIRFAHDRLNFRPQHCSGSKCPKPPKPPYRFPDGRSNRLSTESYAEAFPAYHFPDGQQERLSTESYVEAFPPLISTDQHGESHLPYAVSHPLCHPRGPCLSRHSRHVGFPDGQGGVGRLRLLTLGNGMLFKEKSELHTPALSFSPTPAQDLYLTRPALVPCKSYKCPTQQAESSHEGDREKEAYVLIPASVTRCCLILLQVADPSQTEFKVLHRHRAIEGCEWCCRSVGYGGKACYI